MSKLKLIGEGRKVETEDRGEEMKGIRLRERDTERLRKLVSQPVKNQAQKAEKD